jgi:predicted component of type VI protein secretion system
MIMFATALAVAGCGSSVDREALKLAKEYEGNYITAVNAGTAADRCAMATMVRVAYLQANDERKVRQWSAVADSSCATMFETK